MPRGQTLYGFPLVGKQRCICFLLFFIFFSLRHTCAVTATVPGTSHRSTPGTWVPSPTLQRRGASSRAGPGTKELPKLISLGEPRSSPGSQAPCPVQCSGATDPVSDPVASFHPCFREYFPIDRPRNSRALPGAGHPCSDAAGADGGQSRVGAWGGGSYQHLPCRAWQRLGLVRCRHPQIQAGSSWDEVKVHYFHFLAAAKMPRASCLCFLAVRQAEQTQPATSALAIGADVLLPLPVRQLGLLTSSAPACCGDN